LLNTLEQELISIISERLGQQITSYDTVHGGDINHALRLWTHKQSYFCKYNTTTDHQGIINSELAGLQTLSNNGISVPNNIIYISLAKLSALVMEWIEPIGIDTSLVAQRNLANQLAKLHQVSHTQYGGPQDNYIGSLPQINGWYDSFFDYYIDSRLIPQFRMAFDKGYYTNLNTIETITKKLPDIIPVESPRLIHGDLWSGNYMISEKQIAYFIDPSISYGHREMDIAMLHLFGRVPQTVMGLYNDHTPLIKGWEDRMDIFQFYYLLVHLNIFGRSYKDQIDNILKRYA
jgi:protein-ribulosamine 3-kinase